jgi:hypothetical protein
MPSADSNNKPEQIIEGSIVSYNDPSEHDFGKEIEEGMARAERMSQRQQHLRRAFLWTLLLAGLFAFAWVTFLWQSASAVTQQQQMQLSNLLATATHQQADLNSAHSVLLAKDIREKSARATVIALKTAVSKASESSLQAQIKIECWGRDITDNRIGGWLTTYPYCALNDGGGAANAIYKGDAFLNLSKNQLCVQMTNLHTNSAPMNTLAVGFRITLLTKTFSDGTTVKNIETARFKGRPDASIKDFWQCYPLK